MASVITFQLRGRKKFATDHWQTCKVLELFAKEGGRPLWEFVLFLQVKCLQMRMTVKGFAHRFVKIVSVVEKIGYPCAG